MGRLVLKFISQSLISLSPFLAPLLNHNIRFLQLIEPVFGKGSGFTEDGTRASISMAFLLVFFTVDTIEYFAPRQNHRKFRNLYLSDLFKDLKPRMHRDVRINVMYAKRRWYFGYLIRVFEWTANLGFAPGRDSDVGLRLNEFQGVCGKALRKGETRLEDLRNPGLAPASMTFRERYLLGNQYGLLAWQLRKTESVRAILSIPIYRQVVAEPNPRWKPVGVINLDAVTQEGADWLIETNRQWARYFLDLGPMLAELR